MAKADASHSYVPVARLSITGCQNYEKIGDVAGLTAVDNSIVATYCRLILIFMSGRYDIAIHNRITTFFFRLHSVSTDICDETERGRLSMVTQ